MKVDGCYPQSFKTQFLLLQGSGSDIKDSDMNHLFPFADPPSSLLMDTIKKMEPPLLTGGLAKLIEDLFYRHSITNKI
jgi:hypothetical protein